MNKINLSSYADEINQFLTEARLKNINFDDNKNLTMRERGVARGVYDDSDTSTGSTGDGATTTMNYDIRPSQEKINDKPQASEPSPEKSETPQDNTQPAAETEQTQKNSSNLENLQIAYKKMFNLKKKFEAFKKQCENNELTIDDIIKAAGGNETQQNEQPAV